ncbi:MAG TPA: lipoate--protein ligase family protein [Pseudonocardia sp.]|nr:lipoate--protein ligase family protein [Pseudonocardia sp.]
MDAGSGLPQYDMDWAASTLARLRQPGATGVLRIHRPRPTAAFSRRDSLAAGFPAAVDSAQAHGFEPVVRPAGGRLAAYHRGAVVLDLVARHPEPRRHYRERFQVFGGCLAEALTGLGVDARVGPVPGEYCPGEFSVSAAGATKLAGTAQRLTAHGYLFSTVLLVGDPEPVREVLRDTYPLLGLDWRPSTVGCVADHSPAVTVDEVIGALRLALARLLPLGSG